MQITVDLFAALRERAGAVGASVELPDGRRCADVWPALDWARSRPGWPTPETASTPQRDAPLADGDEVALLPPVSGGGFRSSAARSTWRAVVAQVSDPGAGAIATFIGTTRDHSRGRA